MAGQFRYCSNGLDILSPSRTLVMDPIPLPCNGTNNGGSAWTSDNCRTQDLYGFTDAAVAVAKARLGPEAFSM